jgi:hypothetical protein
MVGDDLVARCFMDKYVRNVLLGRPLPVARKLFTLKSNCPPYLELDPLNTQSDNFRHDDTHVQDGHALSLVDQSVDVLSTAADSAIVEPDQVTLPTMIKKNLRVPGKGLNFFPTQNMSGSPAFVRRSARNVALSVDGISHADEDSILKAMNRASRRNLDGDVRGFKPAVHALSMGCASTPLVE